MGNVGLLRLRKYGTLEVMVRRNGKYGAFEAKKYGALESKV